jgi:DeoR/GlpR family transcriptional regulator of sugar metabolism
VTSGERTWFADQRHAKVLRLPTTELRVESVRLGRHFGVSSESIRKDLAQLDARGPLYRVQGGAVPGQRLREEPYVATNVLSFHRGLTTPDTDEAFVKHKVLAATLQRVFLVDTSKFGWESLARQATPADIDVLVTDDAVTMQQHQRFHSADVTVEVAR